MPSRATTKSRPRLAAGAPSREQARRSQSQTAYDELKRRILDNEMPAGELFLEQELAELLGMSRTPVREALIRLANEGMVEVRPRHGMRVLPVSAADMREIYEILTSLESAAAERVASRGVSAEAAAALQDAVDEMEEALAADDRRRWADADERFHLLLVELCGNQRLRSLVGTFWDQAHRARMITLGLRPRPTASNRDHAAVVDAISRGDAEAARRIHRQHRVRSGELLVDLLEKHGLKQV